MPLDAVRTPPTLAVPVIVGSAVFTGGATVTVRVADDIPVVEPPTFVAVTAKRSVKPPSDDATVYVVFVAPEIGEQVFPDESHCCHW